MESKLTNGGKPHVCGTLQVHKAPKNGVNLCSRCDMPVDETFEQQFMVKGKYNKETGKIDFKIKVDEICEFCGGTGKVSEDGQDSSGNWEKGVETRKCICQLDL